MDQIVSPDLTRLRISSTRMLYRIRMDIPGFTAEVISLARGGDYKGAVELCDKHSGCPAAATMKVGLEKRELDAGSIERALERAGNNRIKVRRRRRT